MLSPPRRDSTPPPTVRLVPAKELAPWLGALMDLGPSFSVETVPAMLRAPVVGGASPSPEYRVEWPNESPSVCCVLQE